MSELCEVKECIYFYGARLATVFRFDNGVKIIGFKDFDFFDLRVLSLGGNPRLNGFGQGALKLIRPLFKEITVNEIFEDALPFWLKMKERGLINHIGFMKGELNFKLMKSH